MLSEAVGLLRFLFVEDVEIEPRRPRSSSPDRRPPRCSTRRRRRWPSWPTGRPPAIEEALKTALVEGLGRKPRQAFGPVRVAISGRTVSPPLYESIELLGRERTLARLGRRPRRRARPGRHDLSGPGAGGRRRALHRSAPDPASRPGSLGPHHGDPGPGSPRRARGHGHPRPGDPRLAAAPWQRRPGSRALAAALAGRPGARALAAARLGPPRPWAPLAAPRDAAARRPPAVPARHALPDMGWWRPVLGLLMFLLVYLVGASSRCWSEASASVLAGGVDLAAENWTRHVDPGLAARHQPRRRRRDPRSSGWRGRSRTACASAGPRRCSAVCAGGCSPPTSVSRCSPRGVGIALSLALAVVGGWEVTGPVESFGWAGRGGAPHHAAAVGRRGVPVPGLPQPGDRRLGRDPRAGAISAALVTAALFSLAHLPAGLPDVPRPLPVGLAASAVVWLTGAWRRRSCCTPSTTWWSSCWPARWAGVATAGYPVAGGGAGLSTSWCCSSMAAYVALVARSGRRLRPEIRTAALDLRRRLASRPSRRGDPPPGAVPPRLRPSGIVFCGAARRHPWGMG